MLMEKVRDSLSRLAGCHRACVVVWLKTARRVAWWFECEWIARQRRRPGFFAAARRGRRTGNLFLGRPIRRVRLSEAVVWQMNGCARRRRRRRARVAAAAVPQSAAGLHRHDGVQLGCAAGCCLRPKPSARADGGKHSVCVPLGP